MIVKKDIQGFSLIEMIVVIVIIAILAAVAVPAVMKYIDAAREIRLITQAINEAALENSDLIIVDLCSDIEIGEDEIATRKPLTGDLHNRVENINSYIVNIYGYGITVVVIENDGNVELAKGG